MGYYSFFELEIKPDETQEWIDSKEIINHFREENHNAHDAIDENGESNCDLKWYDYRKDLCKFSKLYPYAIFILYREGEENKDITRLYVKNGKSKEYNAIITFPEFNESELEQ